MRQLLLLAFFIAKSIFSYGQHCPWDCTGMILLQTNTTGEKISHLNLVLVDEKYHPVTDTVFGTGLPTYDVCNFLSYRNFTEYRTRRIALHHWYQYDTMYHFAEGAYIVKYNFCKFKGKKLYLRYLDQQMRSLTYHYIEIPDSSRIHLHDYNNEIRERRTEEMKKKIGPFILKVDAKAWL